MPVAAAMSAREGGVAAEATMPAVSARFLSLRLDWRALEVLRGLWWAPAPDASSVLADVLTP